MIHALNRQIYMYLERWLKKRCLVYTGDKQKFGTVSKVVKKFITRHTQSQHTLSAAETDQVSLALPAVRF
jgi:hypothetical protein